MIVIEMDAAGRLLKRWMQLGNCYRDGCSWAIVIEMDAAR